VEDEEEREEMKRDGGVEESEKEKRGRRGR